MAIEIPNNLHAACSVNADEVASAFLSNSGFAFPLVRNGLGDYTLTFDQELDTVHCVWRGVVRETLGITCVMVCQRPNDQTIRVRTFTEFGGASNAADQDFELAVYSLAEGV